MDLLPKSDQIRRFLVQQIHDLYHFGFFPESCMCPLYAIPLPLFGCIFGVCLSISGMCNCYCAVYIFTPFVQRELYILYINFVMLWCVFLRCCTLGYRLRICNCSWLHLCTWRGLFNSTNRFMAAYTVFQGSGTFFRVSFLSHLERHPWSSASFCPFAHLPCGFPYRRPRVSLGPSPLCGDRYTGPP